MGLFHFFKNFTKGTKSRKPSSVFVTHALKNVLSKAEYTARLRQDR